MLYQDIALGAAQGASQLINGSARRFIYSAGSAGGLDASIIVHTGSGQIKLYPGQWFEPERPESQWIVRNATGAGAITGTVILTSGEFGDQTITGAVQVVDGGKARTLANVAFWASMNVPSGAWNGTVQLYNNYTAKNLVVESVGLGLMGGVDTSMHIGFLASPLPSGTNQGNARSKKGGGALSGGAQIWTAQPGASLFPWMVDIYCKSNDTRFITPKEPIVVPPGYGLCVDCGAQSQSMAANFEFYEEPV